MPDSKSFAASATGRRLPRRLPQNVGDRRIDELDRRIGGEDGLKLSARLRRSPLAAARASVCSWHQNNAPETEKVFARPTLLCSSGLSSTMFFTVSSAKIFAVSCSNLAAPRMGTIRSRDLAMISSRVIRFAVVPRTVSTRSESMRPSLSVTSTTATRRGSSFSISGSPTSEILARSRITAGSRTRATSCEDLNVTVPSTSINAKRCCSGDVGHLARIHDARLARADADRHLLDGLRIEAMALHRDCRAHRAAPARASRRSIS